MSMCDLRNILYFAIKENITPIQPILNQTDNRVYARRAGCATALGMFAMALCLGFSGCGSNSQPFASASSPSAELSVNPSTIDFGAVTIGTPVSRTVSITNPGTSAIQIAQLSTSSNAFTVNAGALPTSLPAGGSIEVQVRYDPGSATDSTGQLSVDAKTGTSMSVAGAVKLHGK